MSERFWSKVTKKSTNECWDWTGGLDSNGYGRLYFDDKTEKIHRISYQLHCGDIPKKLCVIQRCGNRKCVNPDHLFLGTKRGGHSKLSENDVQDIKSRLHSGRETQERISIDYGVTAARISQINTGKYRNKLKIVNG